MTPLNPARGEVELVAAGRTLRLRFGVVALLAIEEALDKAYPGQRHASLKVFVDLINGVQVSDVPEKVVHVLLLEGLREFQPSITREEVIAIREAAGITACYKAIEAGALRSSLDIKPVEEGGDPPEADPPLPPAG